MVLRKYAVVFTAQGPAQSWVLLLKNCQRYEQVNDRVIPSSAKLQPGHLPLQGETPSNNRHILREPHGQEHLRAENPRVANFYPLL